jgi:hypothetical protein
MIIPFGEEPIKTFLLIRDIEPPAKHPSASNVFLPKKKPLIFNLHH